MKTILLQNVSTKETRTVKQAVLLSDSSEYKIITCDINDLEKYKNEDFVPIGSVEFVKKYASILGIENIIINPYPIQNREFLLRTVRISTLQELFSLTSSVFVKPFNIKQFNGFVFDPNKPISEYSEHDMEQLNIVLSLKLEEFIWISNVVNFVSEYRYYIQNGEIIGYARYDELEEENVPEPNLQIIKNYINLLNCLYKWDNKPYCLDFGVLDSGDTVMVECNEAWAIGLYGDALKPKEYLKFLISGWNYLIGGENETEC